jgi:polysaccharide export outer membrane protein
MNIRGFLAGALVTAMLAMSGSGAIAQNTTEQRLGEGDSIRVSVFGNPDLTVETRVSETGTITYPMVGVVKVGGLTIPLAERAIAKALDDGNFIKKPQVTIQPLLMRSSQVSVFGQVNRAGRFPLDTLNTRVSEMIAIAGGISPAGADIAILTGERAGKPYRREIDITALFLQKQAEQDVVVAGGDVIYVHRAPMFYIYGEVQRAGSYRVERGMTLRQALVQGGGLTPKGTERGLRLHRRTPSGELQVLRPTLDEPVQPDDVIHIGESLF